MTAEQQLQTRPAVGLHAGALEPVFAPLALVETTPDAVLVEAVVPGSINLLETIAYSAAIGMIALTAAGVFDAMLPWR